MPDPSAPPVPAHDWFLPRLTALLTEASRAGYGRDVAEAVITDLMNGPLAATVPPPDENWARDAGEPQQAAGEMPAHASTDAQPFQPGELLEQNMIPVRRIY